MSSLKNTVLNQRVHGKPLAWLDNAATTQKPQSVIDAVSNYYSRDNSNIHRGAHTLAARSTDAFEQARQKVQSFLGASSSKEIIFVRGTTEGINGLRLIGTAREKVGVLSFVLPGRKTEDVGKLLDLEGIAVRAGHHCSQPSLRRFGLDATVRPSFSFYNTFEEIDRLAAAIRRIQTQS